VCVLVSTALNGDRYRVNKTERNSETVYPRLKKRNNVEDYRRTKSKDSCCFRDTNGHFLFRLNNQIHYDRLGLPSIRIPLFLRYYFYIMVLGRSYNFWRFNVRSSVSIKLSCQIFHTAVCSTVHRITFESSFAFAAFVLPIFKLIISDVWRILTLNTRKPRVFIGGNHNCLWETVQTERLDSDFRIRALFLIWKRR